MSAFETALAGSSDAVDPVSWLWHKVPSDSISRMLFRNAICCRFVGKLNTCTMNNSIDGKGLQESRVDGV